MKQLPKNTSVFLFTLFISVLIVAAFLFYNKIKQFEASTNSVLHTSIVKNNLTEIVSTLKDAETGQRGYLLTGDTIFLDSYKGAEQHINLLLISLDTLIQNDGNQLTDVKKIKTLIAARLFILKNNLKLLQSPPKNSISDVALINGKNKMDEVRKQTAIMLQAEDKLMSQGMEIKKRSASVTPIFLLILSLLSIFFLTLFFFRLQKEINERI